MKLFMIAIFCVLAGYAQAQSIIHKPVKIFDGSTSMLAAGKPHVITLDRTIEGLDTSYSFVFDDQQYQELIVVKALQFKNKEELRAFAKTLKMAQTSSFSERVAGDKNGYIISKERVGLGGSTSYQIFIDGSYCYLNAKKTEKLLKVIDSE